MPQYSDAEMERMAIAATLSDFCRICHLTREGYLPLWMPAACAEVIVQVSARVLELKLKYAIEKYPGPTVYHYN